MDPEEKHKIFKEDLYRFASMDRLEFQAKIEVFKDNNPDIAKEDRIDPHISRGELRKFIRDRRRSYY